MWRKRAAAATLDQVLAAVNLLGRKVDTLLQEAGIIMSMQDDLAAATVTLTTEVSQLNTSFTALTALVAQLRQANVDPAIVKAFDDELALLKPSVDKIAAIVPAPPPAP